MDAAGRCYGRLDLPPAEGWEDLLPPWLDALRPVRPVLAWTSPSSRCRLPAEALAAALGIPVRVDARLAELDFGAWEGRRWDRVPRAALDRWAADPEGFAPPGGETGGALLGRVRAVCAALRAEARPCLVASHGGPLRLLGPMLCGEEADLLAPAPGTGALQVFRAGLGAEAAGG